MKKYSKIINNREIILSDKVFVNLTTNDSSAPDYLKLQKNLPIIIDSEYQVLPEIGSKILEKKLKKGNKDKLLLDVSKSDIFATSIKLPSIGFLKPIWIRFIPWLFNNTSSRSSDTWLDIL